MDSLPQLLFSNKRYRKTVLRTGCLALIMMFILNLFAGSYIHVSAAGQTVVMSKPQFKQSEAITLTYTGAAANGKDWIGIYRPGDTPGPIAALSWKYAPAGNGTMSLGGLAPGDYKVIFFSNDSYTELARATIQVIVPVSSVSLSQPSVSISQGTSVELRATIAPANATDLRVSWTSSDPTVVSIAATGGTATLTGIRNGTATVTTTTTDGNFVASSIVTVVSGAVTGITIDKPAVTINKMQSAQLTATVMPANAMNKNVIWSSSDTSIVQVSGLNGTTIANIIGLKVGTAVITVRTEDGNFTQNCIVTVTDTARLGDLAILSFNYGATSASSNWAELERYDINQDNEISIIDLVDIAKKILN